MRRTGIRRDYQIDAAGYPAQERPEILVANDNARRAASSSGERFGEHLQARRFARPTNERCVDTAAGQALRESKPVIERPCIQWKPRGGTEPDDTRLNRQGRPWGVRISIGSKQIIRSCKRCEQVALLDGYVDIEP